MIKNSEYFFPNRAQNLTLSSDESFGTSSLIIGVAGVVVVDTAGGDIEVPLLVSAGPLPLLVTKVYTSGTTATNITRLFSS